MPPNDDIVLPFIQAQIDLMQSWKEDPRKPVTMQDVEKLLETKVPRGPADALAFYDFYTLNIAFEHVWEEILGDNLFTTAQEAYAACVREKDTLPDTGEITGLSDIRRLLREAQALLQERVALAGVPAVVKEIIQWMTPVIWSRLDLQTQTTIITMIATASLPETIESGIEDALELLNEEIFSELYEILNSSLLHFNLSDVRDAWDEIESHFGSCVSGGDTLQTDVLDEIKKYFDPPVVAFHWIGPNSGVDLLATIERLSNALKERHAFDVFAAGSVNFGVLLHYRQEWAPQTYQVGELINTIPLAPKEVRKYTKKETFKESRKRKEVNNALSVLRGDTAQTNRTETEVVRRAQEKTSFGTSGSAQGTVGVVTIRGEAHMGADSAEDSSRTKKNFREAVIKSSQELKSEQKLEVEISTSWDLEETMTGEISNPNEEIAVTYLFYELQRRFKVQEYLNGAKPVILVANDVPNPDEIDEAWLLRHEWILRRVILDDEFLKAFNLLKQSRSGKQLEIDVLRTNVQHHLRAFEDTKIELETFTKTRGATERELRDAVNKYVQAAAADGGMYEDIKDVLTPGGLFGSVHKTLFGDGDDGGESPEAAEARQNAVEQALARVDQAITETRTRLTAISSALDQSIDKYAAAVRARLDRELALMKLRVHVKDNILYYMQAIWEHEPPDQRYFRICDVEVTMYKGSVTLTTRYLAEADDVEIVYSFPRIYETLTLKEVADIDDLLGYKGNYMIFPLIADNYITTIMMQDYLDKHNFITDPDESLGTLLQGSSGEQVFESLRERLEDETEMGADEIEQAIEVLKEALLANEPQEEIVVPSNLLFIAALPGTHPVLEDFKLKHRGLDVLKVAAELEEMQTDLIRRKARLLDKDLSDPEIDKWVKIEGDTAGVEVDIE